MSKRTLFTLMKAIILIAILAMVAWTFSSALKKLPEEGVSWNWWSVIRIALWYQAGLIASLAVWLIMLWSLGQRFSWLDAIWAYHLGHLAKYVPGKALVIVVRSGIVSGPSCQMEIAALAVVFETLSFMATGGILVLLVFAWYGPIHPSIGWFHVLAVTVLFIPLLVPPIFNLAARILSRKFHKEKTPQLPKLRVRTMIFALSLQLLAWLGMGLSLWEILRMLLPEGTITGCFPLQTSQLATAVVMGFLIPTPAGLGSREEVLRQLLQETHAIWLAAMIPLVLRLVWIGSEVLLASGLWIIRCKTSEKPWRF